MKLPRTAYELEPERAQLSQSEKRQAIRWWQSHTPYTPLFCPQCGEKLALSDHEIKLLCPRVWCDYQTTEIPWSVYTCWSKLR